MIFLDFVAKNKELSANSQSIGSWELKYGVRRPDIQNKGRLTLHFTPRAMSDQVKWVASLRRRFTDYESSGAALFNIGTLFCVLKHPFFRNTQEDSPPSPVSFNDMLEIFNQAWTSTSSPFSSTNFWQQMKPMYIKWYQVTDWCISSVRPSVRNTVSSPSDEKIISNHSIFAYNSLQASR